MIINITHKTTVKDVQRKFGAAYPFLKIEFSDKPHKEGELVIKGYWYDGSFKLLSLAKKPEEGWIVVHPWQKTGQIEETFNNRFGLYPQIFRREVTKWIETAGTDVLSLEEQNTIGRKMVDKYRQQGWRERKLLL